MAAMFIAVFAASLVSLNIKTEDGTTVAHAIGFDYGKQTEFSAFEADDFEEQ